MSVQAERLVATPLRLLAAPSADPPYDHEDSSPHPADAAGALQETLPLLFVLPSGLSSVPDGAPLRLVGASAEDDPLFGRRRTPTRELPDPSAWSTRLAQATVEILCGARPVTQLRRWTSDEVYGQLRRNVRRRSRRVAEPRRPPDRAPRVVVRAVRVCEVADGTVEACAIVDDGRRARALVLRLEGADDRWRCTHLSQV